MSDVFLCYRRNDNPQTAWHLAYILNSKGYITFLDTHILGGDLWEQKIEYEIATCAVFICLIGANWLEKDENDFPRIHNQNDNVRKELELAISLEKRILPILVGDATFPRSGDLPESLKAIANIEFVTLRFIPPDFYFDAAKITRRVKEITRERFGPFRRFTNALYRFFSNRSVASICSATASAIATFLIALYVFTPSVPDRYDTIMSRGSDGAPGKVVVGFRRYSIPLSHEGKGGLIEGFMQEACQNIIEKVFPSFAIVRNEVFSSEHHWQGRLNAIEKGIIDIECGSTSITKERENRVNFIETNVYTQTRFLSPRSLQIFDLPGGINFTGKRVNYVTGTTNLEVLNTSGIALNDFKELLDNIRSGSVDAAFTDDLMLAGFAASLNKGSNYIISRAGYGPLEQYGIMFPKDSPKLANALQSAWDELSQQGKICELYRKYFASSAIAPHIKRIYDVRAEQNDDDLKFKCIGPNK
jgi:glutamate/aspartate transport system substrate-binding protein